MDRKAPTLQSLLPAAPPARARPTKWADKTRHSPTAEQKHSQDPTSRTRPAEPETGQPSAQQATSTDSRNGQPAKPESSDASLWINFHTLALKCLLYGA